MGVGVTGQTPAGQLVDSPAEIAARFGLPAAWAVMHAGEHRCLDGRIYRASCLVSDPTCEHLAWGRLLDASWKAAGRRPHDYLPAPDSNGGRHCGVCGRRTHATADPRREN